MSESAVVMFDGKYRIESARLKSWDYTWPGWYYVTICTKDTECFLGEIRDEKMDLSVPGKIVAEEWEKTARIRANVELDEWKIMPNHLHGIIIINDNRVETTRRVVSTTEQPKGIQPNSLGSIIGQIKSSCTKRIWKTGHRDFAWQPRFFDHIIRNEKDLHRIRLYIRNNIIRWELDRDDSKNLPD